ncbi:putative lipoprotein [Limosilactobacillus oris F0423]|uniref:Lipoprotein n=1 Tax=Limosilactobacillus oris F0423 TaxID=944562 RepID=A0ABP2L718_9LACO|nr:hypothetical protein [Limosilactobacillus oris]EGS35924.1 putative lipoprotein [Limosilactobacillus oris F0423]
MITMKKKIISGSLVALMALGLAGCANNSAAPSSKVNHPQTTKLAQSSSKRSTNSSSAKAVNENSVVSASLQANSSSQVASVNTKASYAGQANAYNNDPESDIVNQFIKASGVDNARGTQYMISPANAQGEYQVEVRDSNGDPNISHLDGMYKFNPATNQVQKANRVTGEYEK